MIKTVVCTDCGKEFEVVENNGSYDPTSCPGCDKTIVNVTPTPTSDGFAAWVED